MTELDLDAIEKRAAAATPPTGGDARWWYEQGGTGQWLLTTGEDAFTQDKDGRYSEDFGFWLEEADVAFVAHARQDVPELVAEVRRHREAVERILILAGELTASATEKALHLPAQLGEYQSDLIMARAIGKALGPLDQCHHTDGAADCWHGGGRERGA